MEQVTRTWVLSPAGLMLELITQLSGHAVFDKVSDVCATILRESAHDWRAMFSRAHKDISVHVKIQ